MEQKFQDESSLGEVAPYGNDEAISVDTQAEKQLLRKIDVRRRSQEMHDNKLIAMIGKYPPVAYPVQSLQPAY